MLLALVAPALAQAPPPLVWEPVVEVRGRALLTADGETAREVDQVARLGIEASRGAVSARVSFQGLRSWTATDGGFTGAGSAVPDVAEGWARVNGSLTPNVGAVLTVGRQAIQIDEGRLVGERRWELEGQFLDALRLEVNAAPFSFEYVNARRFSRDADPLGFGVNVVRFGAGRTGPVSRWQVDGLSVVDARDTALTTATVGTFARLDAGRWRSRGEAYVQSNAVGAATLVALEAGWVLGADEGWHLLGGVDAVSGDRGETTGDAAFVPVLGDSHDTWGQLDLFNDPAATNFRGLLDLYVGVQARPARQLQLSARAHRFSSVVDAGAYGAEVDLRATWNLSPFAALEGGYGHFAPVAGFRDHPVDQGYMELDVSF